MSLTPENIKAFEAPLPLEDHEVRAKGKNKAGDKQQWLVYVTQEGIIPLLNSIDPNWTWEVRETRVSDKYVSVTGRLTVGGVFRDGTGGKGESPVDEDTEKAAETDAFKRAAVKFGIGLYLRSAPMIWIPITAKTWDDEAAALKEVATWYKREFGSASKSVDKQTGEITRPAVVQRPAPSGEPPRMDELPPVATDGSLALQPQPDPAPKATAAQTSNVVQMPPTVKANGAKSAEQKRLDKADNTLEMPQIGNIDMKALLKIAYDDKWVSGRNHFINLVNKLYREGYIRDAMNAAQVMEEIRKHEVAKNLAAEQEKEAKKSS